MLSALWDFRGAAASHLVPTLVETIVGVTVSVALAIAAAIALDRWSPVRRAVEPLLVASQTIPIVAIAPLFVIWFGFGLLPKVVIVVLVTFFPVTVALLDGFGRVDPAAMDLMRSMGATSRQTFRRLRWPATLPSLFTGLRISVVYAVIGAIFGEYVGATERSRDLDAAVAEQLPDRPRLRRDPADGGGVRRAVSRGRVVERSSCRLRTLEGGRASTRQLRRFVKCWHA